jgi:hypothetical protein
MSWEQETNILNFMPSADLTGSEKRKIVGLVM